MPDTARPTRKEYNQPTLTVYGSIGELTLAGGKTSKKNDTLNQGPDKTS